MRAFLLLVLAVHASAVALPAADIDRRLLAEVRFHPATIKHLFLYMTVEI